MTEWGAGLGMLTREQLRREFAAAIDEALDNRRSIDEETHRLDHEWIREERERRHARAASIAKVRESVLGWLIIAIVSGIGTLVYHGYEAMKRGGPQ